MSSMPFKTIGRIALKIVSSSLEYRVRVAKPPPVARRQRASKSHAGSPERLSIVRTQELLAAIAKLCSSRGLILENPIGSMSRLSLRVVVLLAEPCSP